VGYWTFDGKDTVWTSSTTATTLDKSGNNNTGTLNGMNQATSVVIGKIGQALKFDGSTSYVGVSNTIATRSVSFWVKPTTSSASMINLTSGAYVTASAGTITATGFTSPTIYVNGSAGSTLTANVWNHIVVTDTANTSANAITIGKANGSYTGGVIDDVRIYNRALSATEVKQLYDMGAGKFKAGLTKAKIDVSPIVGQTTNCTSGLSCGLVGYWTFDGKDTVWTSSTAATTLDKSGNGNTGTLTNMNQSTAPVPGKVGQGLGFNPVSNNDYVKVNISSNLNTLPTMSISFWSYLTTWPSHGGILDKSNCGANGWNIDVQTYYKAFLFQIQYSTTRLQVVPTGNILTLNQWQHWTITWDGTTDASGVHIYENGKEVNYSIQQNGSGSRVADSAYSLTIGRECSSTFPGSIDDVRIYNRALSASEIKQLYNMGK
ncbi:MAG: LamG domain-containing protein, partial [Patescibacteria group bacterium]|nr:LamG domain-containing protein [Patescibacteria group bacterium]